MKQKLLVIIGPTASKKTTLAHQIALALNGSIINADAFQVYRQINCGVNKPSIEKRKEVDYYLIDILDAHESYDIARFIKDVDESIKKIVSQNKIPILVGGSHLYIHAVINGYNLQERPERIDQNYQHLTNKELYDLVYQYDKQKAEMIGLNNRKRLLRYAQFAEQNVDQNNLNESKYEPLIIMTNMKRNQLYDDINKRFTNFITNLPWIQEVEELLNHDKTLVNSNGFKAIGYKEISEYVLNKTPINFELLQQKTRNLAKMQLTWCKNKFKQKIMFDFYNDDIKKLIFIINKWYYFS